MPTVLAPDTMISIDVPVRTRKVGAAARRWSVPFGVLQYLHRDPNRAVNPDYSRRLYAFVERAALRMPQAASSAKLAKIKISRAGNSKAVFQALIARATAGECGQRTSAARIECPIRPCSQVGA